MRIPSGKTDQSIDFVALDSTDRVTRKTGLSAFTVYRSRNGGTATVYTTPTVVELSAANMPGVYALLIDEDTTIASGSDSEEYCVHITCATMAPVTRTIELYRRDTTSGKTALIDSSGRVDVAAVAGAAQTAGDIIGDTNDIQARLPAALVSGRIDASVGAMAAGVLTATAIAADAITDAKVASDVTIASVTGAVGSVTGAVGSVTGAVGSVTGNVGGNVTGSVGGVATGGITSGSFAAGAIDNAAIAADAIGSSELAASAVTEIQTGISTLDAASVRAAIGLASANLDTQIGTLATASALATVAGYVDTEVAAIKAKTDNLPSDPADASDIATAFTALASHGDGAWATADVSDLPTNAELATALAGADDAVLAAVGALSIPTADQNADALLDRADAIETGLTPRQAMRLSAAADGGKLSGGATTTNTIRNAVADDKDRIIATVDASGNRTAITYDLT